MSVLPADTFIVVNKTTLSDKDRNLLMLLYQPIIGSVSVSLYYTLWSYLDKSEILSNEWTHHHILRDMMISNTELSEAKERLEAIGLIKTYLKKGNINSYVYELYSPVSASEFINNPLLNIALFNAVGKLEYERIVSYFRIPKINLREYEDVTKKFSDIFAYSSVPLNDNLIYDIKKSSHRKLELLSKIDINTILSLISDEILNKKSLTKDMKDFLYKISYIYNYDNDDMIELIRNSTTEKHTIDKKLLQENANKYYRYDNMGKLPSIIYKNQPEYLRKENLDTSNRSRMIHLFETTSPYDFINSKYKTGNPTSSDLSIISYLLIDLNLKPGVVNVLVDYVLKINNNKLIKSFVEVIAAQWSKSGIETVEDAMEIAEKEYKKKKNVTTKVTKKESVTPDWFNKDIKEDIASDEEIKKLESRMKRG
ncbi:MAG: DnaD domain protein [Bacilli bacterium]|nr:DnaD domain protein [Bacilli bacterium]